MLLGLQPSFIQRPFRIRYLGAANMATSGATRTYASAPLGTEAPDRLIVAMQAWALTGSTTVSSATIAGNAATLIGQANGTNTGICVAQLRVPTGTTGNIVFNCASAGVVRSQCLIYEITGQSTDTPLDFHFPAGAGDASRAATLDVSAVGGAIAGAFSGGGSGATWTNAVSDVVYTATDTMYGATSLATGALQTNLAITNSLCRLVCAVSWSGY